MQSEPPATVFIINSAEEIKSAQRDLIKSVELKASTYSTANEY